MKRKFTNSAPFLANILLLLCCTIPTAVYGATIYVTPTGAGATNGSGWADAYAAIQLRTAILSAASGDEVWVATGTYKPTTTNNRNLSFDIPNGVKVYGGFAGVETALAQRNVTANVTTLTGDIGTVGTTSDNCYHVVVIADRTSSATRLDGFTVEKGRADLANFGGGEGCGAGLVITAITTNCSPNIANCTFQNNEAYWGGATFYYANNGKTCGAVYTSCKFLGNSSFSDGSAVRSEIDNGSVSNVSFRNCRFSGNTEQNGSGLIYEVCTDNSGTTPSNMNTSYINCLISGNFSYNAGAIRFSNNNGSTLTANLTNCTVTGNYQYYGYMRLEGSNAMTLNMRNCILWNNGNNYVDNYTGSTVSASDNIEQGAQYGGLDQDPLFIQSIDPYSSPYQTGNFKITHCSPAYNTGNNGYVTLGTDLAGLTRTIATTVDIGAYEVQSVPARLYVKQGATGTGSGTSWTNAFTDIQTALSPAWNCGVEVWVAEGTYYPTTSADRTVSFNVPNGMTIYGGFAGTETALGQRNITAHPTILSGDIGTVGTNGDNTYQVVTFRSVDNTTLLDGFTITKSQLDQNYYGYEGGGIFNDGGSPTVQNCMITDNFSGYGVVTSTNWNYTTVPVLSLINCDIYNNTGYNYSVLNRGRNGILTTMNLYNTKITNNYDIGFYNNENSGTSDANFTNVTIANQPSNGVYNEGTITINNSILWNNNGYGWNGTQTLNYTNLQGGWTGAGGNNISTNPSFVNAAAGDYTLAACSPSLNVGSNALNSTSTDLASNTRIYNSGTIDLGAYEYQATPVTRLYVKTAATGTGTGLSWANAMDLQTAINYCGGVEIWCQAGTYYPTASADRTISFSPQNGTQLYGGFAGTETTLGQRNVSTNVTTLSGDIGTAGNNADNSYRIVLLHNRTNVRIDGFTLAQGRADGGCSYCSYGGAISQYTDIDGGVFSNAVANCTFTDNYASGVGGAIFDYAHQGSALTMTYDNCKFYSNHGSEGSAVYSEAVYGIANGYVNNVSYTAIVTGCTFQGNQNHSNNGRGGAWYHRSTYGTGTLTFKNTLMSGNNAGDGGAIFLSNYHVPSGATINCSIINSTITGNYASGSGNYAGVRVQDDNSSQGVTLTVQNSILYGNGSTGSTAIYDGNGNNSVTVANSCVESYYLGTGNITSAPAFVTAITANSLPSLLGDFHEVSCSQTIDAGQNSYAAGLSTDLGGNTRIYNAATVDMGAYEYQAATVTRLYVKPVATGTGTGLSWANAMNLPTALAYCAGVEIWCKTGTYYPTATSDRTIAFIVPSGTQLYGGFAGNETTLAQRNVSTNLTTLSGDIGIIGDNTDNSYRIILLHNITDIRIDGFTLTKGQADNGSACSYCNDGGAILQYTDIDGAAFSNTIANCTFTDNYASNVGGAIYDYSYYGSALTMTYDNCKFKNNFGSGGGGAIYSETGYNGNSAVSYTANVTGCSFQGNDSYYSSGGAWYHYSYYGVGTLTFKNTLFTGNAAYYGGAIYLNNYHSGAGTVNATLINSTIAGNYANVSNAGGIYVYDDYNSQGITLTVKNSILYHNADGGNANAQIGDANGNNTISVTKTSVQGGYTGSGNISSNPAFVSPITASSTPQMGGNFHVDGCSPVIDAGTNSYAAGLSTDLDGNTRIYNAVTVDMGAYEFQGAATAVPATLYVKANATGLNDGTSWTNAFTDLQSALNYCTGVSEVWVAGGTYKPTAGTNRNATYNIKAGLKVYGGFAGTETTLAQRSLSAANSSILSGDIGVAGDINDNVFHIVTLINVGNGAGAARLDGFTVQEGNTEGASVWGGAGILIQANGSGQLSNPNIENCKIKGNYSGSYYYSSSHGAGIYIYANAGNSSPKITDCVFSGNHSYAYYYSNGSAITSELANSGASTTTIVGCTFSGNGGNNYAIYNGANMTIRNSIFWNNNGGLSGNTCTVTYSDIQGGYTGTGNLDIDPNFVYQVSPGVAPTTAGDYHIRPCSPVANVGSNTYATATTDVEGNTRIFNNTVDMGAYEVQSTNTNVPTRLYVKGNATGTNVGTSWTNAFTDLQSALRYCPGVQEIWVAQGTYKPTTFADRSDRFAIPSGVQVLGGFVGTETQASQRNWNTHVTILSGDIGVAGDKTDNSNIVVYLTAASNLTRIDGFTIRDAYQNSAIYSDNSSPTIENCIIRDNAFSGGNGGGLYTYYGTMSVLNCTFSYNKASTGGAIWAQYTNLTVQNCSFDHDSATSEAGAVAKYYNSGSTFVMDNCTFTDNYAQTNAGAMRIYDCLYQVTNCHFLRNTTNNAGGAVLINGYYANGSLKNSTFQGNSVNLGTGNGGAVYDDYSYYVKTYENCLFSGNSANYGGAVYVANDAGQTFKGCTFGGNYALSDGGALQSFANNSNINLQNCILWGDESSSGIAEIGFTSTEPTVSSCIVQGGFLGTNVVNTDPFFLAPQSAQSAPDTLGDYHISSCSPAINAGDNTFVSSSLDLGSQTRIFGVNVDMGAYEIQSTPPVLTIATTNVSCNGGNNGTAIATIAGGTGSFTFSWSNSSTNDTITNLSQGTYTCYISDGGSCAASQSATITQPAVLNGTTAKVNVLCFGASTGKVSAAGSGGTAPYTYTWNSSPVQVNDTAYNVPAGTYTVTVKDANNCTTTKTVTVTQPSTILSATTTVSNLTCNGGNNGTATVSANGGVLGYTYTWNTSPVQYTATATGLSAGTYTITVKDANACTTTSTATITQPAGFTVVTTQTNPTCNGGNNGTAGVSVSGGSGTYTYTWNTVPIKYTASITGLNAGAYTVTISDGLCTTNTTVTLTDPAALVLATTQTNVLCNGATTGTATVTATGGTGTKTYTWNSSPVQYTATASGLGAGTYTVTVKDANNCTTTASVTLTQPAVLALTTTQVNVLCNGANTASATVSATGGTAVYTYTWNTSPVQYTATASGLIAGTYIITVKDANNCTATASVTITQPAALVLTTTQVNVLCNGATTGTATVTATGGTGTKTYTWNTSPVQYTATASSLAAGTYMVTVKDANNCTATASVTLTQPSALVLTTSSVNINCNGATTGTATVAATGGTGTKTYTWNTSPVQYTATASSLTAGTYIVTVKDVNNCTATASVTITQPAALVLTTTQVNVLCNGATTGTATVTATGGTGTKTYTWNTSPVQYTTTASSLGAGTYTVTVKDANNCTATASVTITQPAAIVLTTTQTNLLCNGATTGTATVTATGGTGTKTYTWNTSPVQYTATASNLAAGTYTVTVKDANNCSATAGVTITQPTALVLATTQTNVLCNLAITGTVTVAATGGTGTKTYTWNTSPIQYTATANGLAAGTYTVTVKDANNCTATASVTITQPAALTLTTTQVNVLCNGATTGTATVAATGGTGTKTYTWNTSPVQYTATASGLGAGIYNVTVKDANNCTATASVTITQPSALTLTATQSNVLCFGGNTASVTLTGAGGTGAYQFKKGSGAYQAIATFSSLSAGTYTFTVKDANNCTATLSVTITQPTVLAGTTTTTNVSCNGGNNGTATVTATGGTATYTYTWNTSPAQYTATASGLSAGTYAVIVKDANNCTATTSVTITQPTVLALTTTQVNVLCNGATTGSATVTATGGTGTKTYTWNTSPVQYTATANSLAAGTYIVTVKDANNCIATANVTITQPAVLALTTTQVNVLCNGATTGTATVTASGGTGTKTYTWNTSPVQYTATASGLGAGTYNVTVKDANNCTATASVTITQPSALTLTATQSNVLCFGGSTGSVTLTGAGGIGAYLFKKGAGAYQAGNVFGNLVAGTYTFTVKDANNCTATLNVTITQPAVLAGTTTPTNVLCNGGNTGSATVSITGGTSPYLYTWNTSPAQYTSTATGLIAGSYSVAITDNNGCALTKTVVITQPNVVNGTVTGTNVTCNGGNNGTATATGSGGTAPYTYTWNTSPVQYGSAAIGLIADTFAVNIVDANGCSVTKTKIVTQPTAIVLTTTQVNVLCNGATTGTATVIATGGTGTKTYTWNTSPVQYTATASGLAAGTYMVTVKDANNCIATANVTITQPTVLALTTTQVNVLCNGANTASATVSVMGGTVSYTYTWNTSPVQYTATASGLAAGTYMVTVKDANNCTATANVTITQPAVLALTTTQVNVLCNGATTGTATVTATGGTGTKTYTWSNGATTSTTSGLGTGTYMVTVTDANNCTATASITITQPSALTLTATQSNVLCFGGSTGSVSLTAAGGTGAYLFKKGAGAYQAGNVFGSLVAGTYTFTVKDANNCTATLSVTITQPAILAGATTPTNVLCNGGNTGSATISITGGTSPYLYTWNTSPAQYTATATGLTVGSYSVAITDSNGCALTKTVVITQPNVVNGTVTGTNVTCNGGNNGTATATGSGGTAPYTYTWNTSPVQYGSAAIGLIADTFAVNIVDANGCSVTKTKIVTEPTAIVATTTPTGVACYGGTNGSIATLVSGGTGTKTYTWDTSPATYTASISGLQVGIYILTITDANSCTMMDTTLITQPDSLDIQAVVADVACNGGNTGAITLNVIGGTGIYQYKLGAGTYQAGNMFSNLASGTYPLTVKDGNNCTKAISVMIAQLAPIIATSSQTNVACHGGNNGAASVLTTGGNGVYTYTWNTTPAEYTDAISGLIAGQYMVTVTDSNNCMVSTSVTITEPSALLISVNADSIACEGDSAMVVVTASGGTAPYNGTGTFLLPAGTHFLTITDANACTISDTMSLLAQGFAPIASFSSQITGVGQVAFTNSSSGSISTYSWNFGDNGTAATANPTHSYTANGTYQVSLIVSNNCGSDTVKQEVIIGGVAIDEMLTQYIIVYPNPANDLIHVSIQGVQLAEVAISLISIEGKMIESRSLSKTADSISETFNVSHLAKGVYLIQVTANGKNAFLKFVKE